ncbi:MAG: hypothetical protein V2A63_02140 [Patescibacteria group bacterium]
MINEIKEKLQKLIEEKATKNWNERDVVYYLAEARKMMEQKPTRNYPELKFLCNWALHFKKDRNKNQSDSEIARYLSNLQNQAEFKIFISKVVLDFLKKEDIKSDLILSDSFYKSLFGVLYEQEVEVIVIEKITTFSCSEDGMISR